MAQSITATEPMRRRTVLMVHLVHPAVLAVAVAAAVAGMRAPDLMMQVAAAAAAVLVHALERVVVRA